ncbi:MAG: hypothetical protein J6B94_08455 [Lachnospiraceae bacterium]|nr:hypothetical protein [Lachnospiraceae bacterium]
MEFSVNIYIETSRRGPSKGPGKYMYVLEYILKDGTPYTVDGTESFEETRENELALKAIIAAGKRLTKPCSIRIFTGCDHILSTTHNGWYIEWQKNGWKKKNGKEVRNAALWEELVNVMDLHAVTYTKDEHSYKRWMREELSKGG